MINTFVVYRDNWQCDECVVEPCVESEGRIIGIGNPMLETEEAVVNECNSFQVDADLTLLRSIAGDAKLRVFPDGLGSGRLTNKDDIDPNKITFLTPTGNGIVHMPLFSPGVIKSILLNQVFHSAHKLQKYDQ